MNPNYNLGVVDYIMVAISLLVSVVIGIRFHFFGGNKNTENFLLAGKNMSKFPVILSVVVTGISAIAMLGNPVEVYRYGAYYTTVGFAYGIGMVFVAYVIVPVYFQCGVSTTYEYLEMRFGKVTKYTVSGLFILQTVMYMSVALYAPALALSAVTDISVNTSIFLCAGICTFYCTLGGLKAVLWTDVLQSFIMFITIIILYIKISLDVGSLSTVWNRASEGDRLHFVDFSLDFTTRHTFWNIFLQGIVSSTSFYGTNQILIQRLFSMNSSKRAQSSLLWSVAPVIFLSVSCSALGLFLFGFFYKCDPIINQDSTGVYKYDQLLPYYIVTGLVSIPGLRGFCIAGIFSAFLSTLSSVIHSLSTVTVTDFIQPLCSFVRLNEKRLLWTAKGLALFYGILCICLSLVASKAESILQTTTVLLGLVDGPLAGIYLIGVLTSKFSQKSILVGLLLGTAVTGWIGFGSFLSGYVNPPLPLPFNSSYCTTFTNATLDSTAFNEELDTFKNYSVKALTTVNDSSEIFILYRISFMWIPTIGCFLTICFSVITSLFTDRNKIEEVNSKCLSPVTRIWTTSTSSRTNGINSSTQNQNLNERFEQSKL